MASFTDGLNRTIEMNAVPQRIISVVPSQTELLYDLGLAETVIGITKFCVHPQEWFKTKTRIGGTKTLNIEKIKSLQPDLILANKEENIKEQIEELAAHFPVWISDVATVDDALNMIDSIGHLTSKQSEAQTLISSIQRDFSQLQIFNTQYPIPDSTLRTAYLIWQDPYMTVGGDTFINDLLMKAGFENVFAGKQRYPIITLEELQAASCELLLLSTEPFPFKQKHVDELQSHLPNTKIILADGEMFSWYGSRLQYVPAYLKHLQQQINAML